MKSLIAPGIDGSYSSFTRHPHSWLGKTAPSATDIVPSFYKDRPASVSVLGKKISSDAVITVNADAKFCPRPVSFESAKPKQHFQRSRQLHDFSTKPSAHRANSAVNPKILSKIKIYAEARSTPRNRKDQIEDKPTKKPRPPRAPRPDKPKGQKKAGVPRTPTEDVAKAPKRENPHISLVPKIDEIVQQSLKEAYEIKLRDEEERQRKLETEHRRKQHLRQQNLQVRRKNKRFQGGQFKSRAAWGTDERRIYGKVDEKSKLEARMDRESKLLRRKRAKSAGKDRIGVEALNEIKAELRPNLRSQSVMAKLHDPRSGRGSPAKEMRSPDPAIKDYMKHKKQETRNLYERQCISQLAMEAKRLSQLKDLEVKAKTAIQKFKRKRRQTHKRPRPLDLLMTNLSQTGTNPEDDEVLGIMHRLGDRRPELDEREGRESRVFGVLHNQPSLTEERGNATQVLTADRRDDDLYKLGNITAPIDLKAEWNSSHDHLLLDSQLSSLPRIIDPIESSLFEDSGLQLSEISKRKEDIRKKVADLRRRADEVKLKVSDEAEVPLKTEGSEGTPLNLPVIKAADFEQMMQEDAAIKIQSNIRRFLAMSLLEQLKAELSPVDDLSFHSDDIEEKNQKKSKLSDRLRIGIRTEVIYSDDESEPEMLGSDSQMDLEEDEDAEEESIDVKRPTSDPYRRPRSFEQSKDSDDLDQFFRGSRPANPDPEDFEHKDNQGSQGKLQSILLHELQSMKSREQALEDLIEQANSRQQAEEVKQIQMKEDLAKLREYDRHMLEEVAARSGASMLTELLSRLFDQRYGRLEELFKGNRKALQEAISGDLPYFEQLEQCLKEAEDAKKTGRGEATSIERLLDNLIENSEEVPKSSQDSILESREESASFDSHRGKDKEAARRTNFAEEIAKLEQELYEQEEHQVRRLGDSGRHGLKRQPFSGMLVGLDSLKNEEPEQHISDLSAEIESSCESEGSVHVLSRPFDVVPVYISTEEDLPCSPKPHQESPVCVNSVAFEFPVIRKPLFESRDELVPSMPEIPVSPVVMGQVSQKKPESPVVSQEKPVLPVVSQERLVSPMVSQEKPVLPIVLQGRPVSPIVSQEKSVSSNVFTEKSGVSVVSPEKPVSPVQLRPKVDLKLDDILLEDSEGDLREAEYTQVNIAEENLVDEILEHLLDEAIHILQTEVIPKTADDDIQSPDKSPRQQHSSSQGTQSADVKSQKVEELKSQDQRLASDNAKDKKPSPKKDKGDLTSISVGAELAEEILIDLLKAELKSFPNLDLSPPLRQLPSMPELSLSGLGSQRDNFPSYSADLGLRTDVEAVISYVNEVFNFNLQEASSEHLKEDQELDPHSDLKGWMGLPLQSSPSLLLEQLQNAELTSFSGLALTKPPEVINVDCYIELEKARSPLSSRQAMLSPNTAQAVSEAGNIHNKMIFDCINEALAKLLPYGLKGVPMPWSSNTRALAPELVKEARVCAEVKKNISRWCSIQAGKLPSGDMVMSSGLIDEEYLQQVRVERLEACISLELLEHDDVWVDYEFEETQAKLDLADIVLELLVAEAVSIMQVLTR
jgi:hypothetical protein